MTRARPIPAGVAIAKSEAERKALAKKVVYLRKLAAQQ